MFLTMNRVSNRRVEAGAPFVSCRSKCLIQTAPAGNDQLFVGEKPMVRLVLGTENQRVFCALSDQNGTFRSYCTMPGFGASGVVASGSEVRLVNPPGAASVRGHGVPITLLA